MRVFLTDHAINRYIERVKGHYNTDQARDELLTLCQEAQPLDLSKYPHLREGEYIELSDGIFAPVVKVGEDTYRVLTLMTRGSYEDSYRARVNSRNQSKRFRKGQKHRHKGNYDRREPMELDYDSAE